MWNNLIKVCFWLGVGFIFFAHLDHLTVMIYDEGRLAVSAYEMNKYGHYLVPYYDAAPDMWSVKPPFMIWCQVFFIKILGYGITAIRLPSALAGLGTAVIIFQFMKKNMDSELIRYLAVAVLVTTPGYIIVHGTRTGDYDSMFIMFNTFYCLQFYNYVKFQKNRFLLYVFLGIFLAVMTKGVAGLICAPFLVIMSFRYKAVLKILKTPYFYLYFFILVSTIFAYYFYRESINSGYWNAVVYEELGGRFSGSIDDNKQPWYYYLRLIFVDHYYFWLPITTLAIGFLFYEKKDKIRDVLLYCIIAAIYFLFIITITGTKREWYEMPMYPFLAVVVAYAINQIFYLIKNFLAEKKIQVAYYIPSVFIAVLFFYSFRTVKDSVFFPKPRPFEIHSVNISHFLRDQFENLDDPEQYILVNEGYSSHLLFYKYFHRENGIKLQLEAKENVHSGNLIIVYEEKVLEYLKGKFHMEELGEFRNVKVRKIGSEKK